MYVYMTQKYICMRKCFRRVCVMFYTSVYMFTDYVCMCKCFRNEVAAHTCTHTNTRTHEHTQAAGHAHTHAWTHMHTRAWTHTGSCTHTHTHTQANMHYHSLMYIHLLLILHSCFKLMRSCTRCGTPQGPAVHPVATGGQQRGGGGVRAAWGPESGVAGCK